MDRSMDTRLHCGLIRDRSITLQCCGTRPQRVKEARPPPHSGPPAGRDLALRVTTLWDLSEEQIQQSYRHD